LGTTLRGALLSDSQVLIATVSQFDISCPILFSSPTNNYFSKCTPIKFLHTCLHVCFLRSPSLGYQGTRKKKKEKEKKESVNMVREMES
jgi:hypothetical protein